MSTAISRPDVEAMAADVMEARTVLSDWEALRASAEARIADLETMSGERYLADPDAVQEVPKQLRELRDQVTAAESAAEAQRLRIAAAERRWLIAQADVLEASVAEAQSELDVHIGKTERLLKALVAHDGPYVTEAELAKAWDTARPYVAGLPERWRLPTSEVLRRAVTKARMPVWALRELADGRDPARQGQDGVRATPYEDVPAEELHPACVWGPTAVVQAPAYSAWLERTTIRLESCRAALEVRGSELAALDAEIATEVPRDPRRWSAAEERAEVAGVCDSLRAQIADLEQRLAGHPLGEAGTSAPAAVGTP